mmetsp:Transcript_73364/g.166294  ORF Transcript_73364/g.166294 Transcript_73364/m.166294 type:complete len:320 (-) Transcript_73364:29-988(-)|eukprot:CAMPEP_0197917476 /NCGR_PEP_ID=MMETSP1439-20131203/83898_1 /TAXON_ID=66791 /ORGANISM="Gonyaulax spinifera, Strain CCMP409" /LENGTH=319 /DNA_ID=CAMNT_0043539553 /DNA_START=45 /DNA_END=1004 /DNA_ORIENTATION=+
MATFTIRVEEGGLGVKLSPEPLSSKVFGLRVVRVNDPVRAERAMLQVGDLLYAVNGTTFSDPKDFLQWVRLPPYMLTILRKEEGDAVPDHLLEGASSSGAASSSSAVPGQGCSASSGSSCGPGATLAAPATGGGGHQPVALENLVEQAIQTKLPKGWRVGRATGIDNNCLLDSLLQILRPELNAGSREEQAKSCREALVKEGACSAQQFLNTAHMPRVLALLGVTAEETTVFVVGFAELEQCIAPERCGRGTARLLVLANVSRHAHFAPVFVEEDGRIGDGLKTISALEDAKEREEALDSLFGGLLGYSQGCMPAGAST